MPYLEVVAEFSARVMLLPVIGVRNILLVIKNGWSNNWTVGR
jgi:hypothetical protein